MSQNPVRLAKALRDYGTGNMPNLWPQVSSLRVRTLILTGEKDEKFVQIGQKLKKRYLIVELYKFQVLDIQFMWKIVRNLIQ